MRVTKTVLLTGAAGAIGSAIRPHLLAKYGNLRLFDLKPVADRQPGEDAIVGDLRSPTQLRQALEGVDCVMHLAGVPREDAWPLIRDMNIEGTYNLFEAARLAGVPRVVYASSHHTIAFTPFGHRVPVDAEPRPTGLYGVSKLFGEALGRLYSLKFGLSVICLRIAAFRAEPHEHRHLSLWISPRDIAQLTIRSIDVDDVPFLTVFGVSANARNPYDRAGWDVLGYVPDDDAERYVGTVPDPASDPGRSPDRFYGGQVCLDGLVER